MKSIYLIIFFILGLKTISLADGASSSNSKGIKSYKEGDYAKSVEHFTNALVDKPGTPELLFNLGTALSALGKKEEALQEFSKIPELKEKKYISSSTHYNSGNLLLKSGDNQKAIEEYSKALKLDQKSRDIRHNLELAIKRKAQQDKQQKSSNQKQKQNNPAEKQKGEEDNQKNQLRRDEDDENSMSISQEETERILNAFQNEERRALELRKNKQTTTRRLGNDW